MGRLLLFLVYCWLGACGGAVSGRAGSGDTGSGDTGYGDSGLAARGYAGQAGRGDRGGGSPGDAAKAARTDARRAFRADTAHPAPADAAEGLAGDFAPASALRFDSVRLSGFYKRYPDCRATKDDLRAFYRQRRYSFAWFDREGLTEQAASLYDRILELPGENPSAAVPYVATLDTLLDNAASVAPGRRLETELLLTSAYFYFAEKAWKGIRPSKTTQLAWYVPRKKVDYSWWLHRYAAGADAGTASSEPVYKQYALLRDFLERYRELASGGRWPVLRMAGGGGDTAFVRQVGRRLVLLGDMQSSAAAASGTSVSPAGVVEISASLADALRRFQRRTGLTADGKLGPSTLRELNISPAVRVKQILVNMERNRWLNATPSGDYLAVNIPEFRLHAFQNDTHLWDMKVVVGRSVHRTAIFAGTLQNIVFSPYWNVPPGILYKEVLPRVARDPGYLARNHMERYGGGVRQKPGPWNALGGVKFLFPNSHNIYLHDSPEKDKFLETSRAFSHGCIRLAEPAKVAGWLLRGEPAWTPERIAAAMHAGKEKWIPAPGEVRVVIVYFTAWVDEKGVLNFRRDIYRRDERLAREILPEGL